MPSNLRIAYYDLLERCNIDTAPAAETGYEVENIALGARSNYYRTSAAATTIDIDFQTGTAGAYIGDVDYYIIGRANLETNKQATDVTYTLFGDDNGAFSSPESVASAISDSDLLGPNSEDYINTTAFASNYRYWRFRVAVASSRKIEVGKLYAGVFWDPSTEPVFPASIQRRVTVKNQRKPAWIFDFTWQGVNNTDRQTFIDNILEYKDVAPVFLHDTSDYILQGDTLVHAWVREVEITPTEVDTNTIRVTFEELT